ncbi:MAG TPA: hypothetical protein VF865_17725 [Acidobacteriaceae bacterium]
MVWGTLAVVLLLLPLAEDLRCQTQAAGAAAHVDSDADGLDDAVEQQLLEQFAPRFMVGRGDCSGVPAEFKPNLSIPTVAAEDGTIYGQVFPAKRMAAAPSAGPEVELHYYHLWRQDCGAHAHPLDTEHVAVLVRASQSDLTGATWRALYWYAAAHEQTVCDVSQIARASTLQAEDRGAQVWISPGKHASYLDERLCNRGCGADRCEAMVPLRSARVINLGEPGRPMNASLFISSSRWPLTFKMEHTNFPAEPIGRLERLSPNEIAWFNPGRHPAQGVIAVSSTTGGAIGKSASETASSLGVADDSASDAISVAGDSTGNALGTSYRKTVHALGTSARHVGRALGLSGKPKPDPEPPK